MSAETKVALTILAIALVGWTGAWLDYRRTCKRGDQRDLERRH